MPTLNGFADFNPDVDIPSLKDKVIFITGGTAGLGAASVEALARHDPAHIYFSGRNAKAGEALVDKVGNTKALAALTFIEMDLSSLSSVKAAARKFAHNRLDILICNAGILNVPPSLSKDGYEIFFATNHLGHAMLIQQLLPIMINTSEIEAADVRIVCLASPAWRMHPKGGVDFPKLTTVSDGVVGSFYRLGQSKLANIVYAAELARRYPNILSVSVHPGVTETGMITNLPPWRKTLVHGSLWMQGQSIMKQEQGILSQLWAAAGAKRSEIVNGAFYMPVGVLTTDKLDKTAKSEKLGTDLWEWTEQALGGVKGN
ncbi:Oxidoreductase, short-chain dehydrogenase family [Venustampulla echinocandica]|uniref:Oxidoreductase, short-chain dehydrogenase family n=1 Tax=Venustampulla echinocandica TaxID=2656787 RepID=A0A370TMF3_9HELO|nr:Oxidoreductase, short-chain dehydrogenase family [Venustampulla echinocandica]RDL36713.1 Oxidoreductase, short-chain dehydrogenase family [Venustampulla echinocandica]